jgi:carboxypeptidase Taq
MKSKNKTIQVLLTHYREIATLGSISRVLDWDLNVNLPEKAAVERGEQSAYLTGLTADKWQSADFQRNLEKAAQLIQKLTHEEQAIVRNLAWSSNYYTKIPKELLIEHSKVCSEGFLGWRKAREQNDFAVFEPYLSRIVEISRMFAQHLGYEKDPYDALLNLYEQNMTVSQLDPIFNQIIGFLTPFLKNYSDRKSKTDYLAYVNNDKNYPIARQKNLVLFIIKKMGYDIRAGRMDESAHPFTLPLGRFDVRITNRYKPHDLRESIAIGMHEAGHALYEQGVDETYAYTPLDSGVSLGIHESQSRFWENQIGKSTAFLSFLTPVLQAYFPEALSDCTTEELFELFNHVEPSLIRTEADEVTYNLHIALRYELEKGIINGKIKVKDLPKKWNEGMKSLLGVEPKSDSEGILQDVHWSYGAIGYFPTYTLGNLYSAQFTNKMQKELDIINLSGNGDLGTILVWLRDNIHRYGSLYWPDELCQKITGEPLNPKYFIEYIKNKY